MPHLLIYDADLSGHHLDYLDAVVDYLEANPTLSRGALQVSLMFPSAYWLKRKPLTAADHTHRVDIDAGFWQHRNALSPRKRALLEIKMLACVVKRHSVDELMLMNLDYFQVALASPSARSLGCEVSGIHLQPYTRSELVSRDPDFKPGLWFRALRKRFRLQQMLKNISMARLCVPADLEAVNMLNARHASQVRAVVLPEPYLGAATHRLNSDFLPDVYKYYDIRVQSRIVLVFGNIIARKNVENVIRAMRYLHDSGCSDVVLLVVGKANPAYQQQLRDAAGRDSDIKPVIRFDFDFVSDEVLAALFRCCDVVAMPYFKTYQSSGILFQALKYGKPVITAYEGLVNQLVQDYQLGESVDPRSPKQIAAAMYRLLESWQPSTKAAVLNTFHTPENHAAVLLNQTQA